MQNIEILGSPVNSSYYELGDVIEPLRCTERVTPSYAEYPVQPEVNLSETRLRGRF